MHAEKYKAAAVAKRSCGRLNRAGQQACPKAVKLILSSISYLGREPEEPLLELDELLEPEDELDPDDEECEPEDEEPPEDPEPEDPEPDPEYDREPEELLPELEDEEPEL